MSVIKLFDLENGVVVPSVHCHTLDMLKRIMTVYPDPEEHIPVYCYLFYMTCPNPDLNPFFEVAEHEKEKMIMAQVGGTFTPDELDVSMALEFCKSLYQTPTYRAYIAIKNVLDKLASYLENTTIEHGRDGNITAVMTVASKFDQLRSSFKGISSDLASEQSSNTRGGFDLAYDQE